MPFRNESLECKRVAAVHPWPDASAPDSGRDTRRIGPVWRGTSFAVLSSSSSWIVGRCSHPEGTGARRRKAPASDSKVSHPFSNPAALITAPLIGTVFHTRQFMPDASVMSLLGIPPPLSKVDSTPKAQPAQWKACGVVSHRLEPESARSVLLLHHCQTIVCLAITSSTACCAEGPAAMTEMRE